MKYILSVDPGSTGTGFCAWESKDWRSITLPVGIGQIFPSSSCKDWQDRCNDVFVKLTNILETNECCHVYCEYQEFFEGSARGRAATIKGDITKLTYFTGMIGAYCLMRGIGFTMIKPSEWRGQMSDYAVKERLKRRFGEEIFASMNLKAHSQDAVGIGLYAKGVW